MSIAYYSVIFLTLIIFAAAGIIIYLNKKKEKRENEVVPHTVGNKTIYLRRKEIPHFEARSREDQRKEVNRFHAQVKAGKFLPITKQGRIIGYVKNEKWIQIKNNR